jgi:hypothetical protein
MAQVVRHLPTKQGLEFKSLYTHIHLALMQCYFIEQNLRKIANYIFGL